MKRSTYQGTCMFFGPTIALRARVLHVLRSDLQLCTCLRFIVLQLTFLQRLRPTPHRGAEEAQNQGYPVSHRLLAAKI
jgi:hypothetical protein